MHASQVKVPSVAPISLHLFLCTINDVTLAFRNFSPFSIEIIFVSIVQHQIEQLDGHYHNENCEIMVTVLAGATAVYPICNQRDRFAYPRYQV